MQTVTIPVDGMPDGYECVRFGHPLRFEQYVDEYGRIETASCDYGDACYLIVRHIYKPPTWLKPGWIVANSRWQWFWCESKPQFVANSWAMPGYFISLTQAGGKPLTCFDFTPPVCTDHRQSLTEIKAAQ